MMELEGSGGGSILQIDGRRIRREASYENVMDDPLP